MRAQRYRHITRKVEGGAIEADFLCDDTGLWTWAADTAELEDTVRKIRGENAALRESRGEWKKLADRNIKLFNMVSADKFELLDCLINLSGATRDDLEVHYTTGQCDENCPLCAAKNLITLMGGKEK
jgi:hypothetical protein